MTTDLKDQPYGVLSSVGRVQLAGSRIEGAVAEIRFIAAEDELSAEVAERLLKLLGPPTGATRLDRAAKHELALNVSPGGEVDPQATVTAHGWRVMTSDETVVFTVLPGQASVQIREYGRWRDSLGLMLDALLDALVATVRPTIVQRIGLRYINLLDAGPDAPEGHHRWVDRIHPAILGPVTHPLLGPCVRATQQRIELELEAEVGATVNHGPVGVEGEGGSRYLVDADLYCQASTPFTVEDVRLVATRLNRTAVALFRAMLTEAQFESMEPTVLDAPEDADRTVEDSSVEDSSVEDSGEGEGK